MTAPRTPAGIIAVRTAPRILRSGKLTRPEIWEARTADMVWDFERGDEPGTPWYTYHRPSVADGSCTMPVNTSGSLAQAAAAVECGYAAEGLARIKAELAGGR